MTAKRYRVTGIWVPNEGHYFFGEFFSKFVAELPSMHDETQTKRHQVTIFLPPKYKQGSGIKVKSALDPSTDAYELELEPGTYVVQLVPYTTVVGDPSSVTRPATLFVEDLLVEPGGAININALPAS